ncbi:MAG TPA: biotin--[acetyl-CoA-carboxylase] ligase [Anaerolineales bacterium]|jgi:BirA family biotin operon repressor/biotin-[acetyl-CoA-carboxylase] ligase|nr:biotin--[acetyl-CoA-carboxylase] ligase [Anaerolineales bacterium]
MKQQELETLLANLNLGDVRFFDSIGSTNDEALAWAKNGARDLSLVIADEQTLGRGRLDRPWFTPPKTALAFSLILRPTYVEKPLLSRTVGLAALSLADVLQTLNLDPQIKWPNDVLLNGRKLAGILIEATWSEDEVSSLVIGMGINIAKAAVPSTDILGFPATSLENMLGYAPDRKVLLHAILANIIALRPHLGTESFLSSWEKKLAYNGRQVRVEMGGEKSVSGRIVGLESDGSLRLKDDDGKFISVRFGDVRLRLFA